MLSKILKNVPTKTYEMLFKNGRAAICAKIPINFEVFYPDAVEKDPDPVKKRSGSSQKTVWIQ